MFDIPAPVNYSVLEDRERDEQAEHRHTESFRLVEESGRIC